MKSNAGFDSLSHIECNGDILHSSLLSVSEVSDLLLSKITWENNYPKGDDFIRTFVACFSWVHLESLGVNLNLKKS